jgi:hypothetical protein
MHNAGQGLKASPIDNLKRFLDLWIMFLKWSLVVFRRGLKGLAETFLIWPIDSAQFRITDSGAGGLRRTPAN